MPALDGCGTRAHLATSGANRPLPSRRGNSRAFSVDEMPGPRWDVALDLLRDGGHLFLLPGGVPVALQRYIGWPAADGLIHVSVFTSTEPLE